MKPMIGNDGFTGDPISPLLDGPVEQGEAVVNTGIQSCRGGAGNPSLAGCRRHGGSQGS